MKTLLALFGFLSLVGAVLVAGLCVGLYAGYCARLDAALASAEAFKELVDDLRRAPAGGVNDRSPRPTGVRAGLGRAVELYSAPKLPWRLEAVEMKDGRGRWEVRARNARTGEERRFWVWEGEGGETAVTMQK
jgi:hypothetical protein